MSIVGESPEAGVRWTLERPRDGGPPWRYRGQAAMRDRRLAVAATVSSTGEVSVEVAGDAPPGLAERARLLLRSVWKRAQADGAAPPLRVSRWRRSG
jgi:hypothetical protein